MKKKFIGAMIIVGIICLGILVVPFLAKETWEDNAELLKKNVLSIEQTKETVKFSDITPFEWDKVYSFPPYTPKEKIYKVIGFK